MRPGINPNFHSALDFYLQFNKIFFVFAELPVSGTLRDNDQLGLAQEKQKS